MDRNFTNLVKEVSSYSITDIKEKTRNKIKERIEELRKNDDLFLKEFESREKIYGMIIYLIMMKL